MSRDRGLRLQNALAAYLRQWWAGAESAGSGRPGRDVLGTPGVWFECKAESLASMTRRRGGPAAYVRQAAEGTGASYAAKDYNAAADVPVVVWWPPGVGADRPELAVAMLPLPELMDLLVLAEYAPAREGVIL